MKSKMYWILAALYFTFLVNNSFSAQEQRVWTMEFRIAAHPIEDANLVQKSRNDDRLKIYEDGILVGTWVKTQKSAEQELKKNPE